VPDVDVLADVAGAADVPAAGELVVDGEGVVDGLAVDPAAVSRDDGVKDGRESRGE
jgi:hypothetical protein